MIAAVVELFAALIQTLATNQHDRQRQEEALMAAEEKLSRIRAKAKFG